MKSIGLIRYLRSGLSLFAGAARADFLTASIVPVLLGSALAWRDSGLFDPLRFVLCILGITFIHAGANLMNDYWDHRSGADWQNDPATDMSGGSRFIQTGKFTPRRVLRLSVLCYVIGAAAGIRLNGISPGNTVLYLGLFGVSTSYFYTASPLRLGYRGMGEVIVGLNFGPLSLLGSYFVQRREMSSGAIWISLPIMLLIMAVLVANEFLDFEADRRSCKGTMVVRLGRYRSLFMYSALLILPYVAVLIGILAGGVPLWGGVILCTLPIVNRAVRNIWEYFDDAAGLRLTSRLTITLHVATGLLLCVALLMDRAMK